MAQINKDTFNAQFNNSGGGYFPTNNTQVIASSNMRKQALDLKDSAFFLIDDAYTGAKGLAPGINTIAGLKAIPTAPLSASGLYILFRDSGASNVLRVYELVTGMDAESSPDIIRPSDYAATTNEKVWKIAIVGGTLSAPAFPIWEWSAHADTPPVSTAAGQAWMTKGVYDDGALVIPDGSQIIAKIIGADTVDNAQTEYWIK